MTALDLTYPDTEFEQLVDKLRARLNRAGWLTQYFPAPRRGYLLAPFEPIPLLLLEPAARTRLLPVFCICPADWTPEANQIYARYIDLPFLIRAVQSLYPAAAKKLRVYLYSRRNAWFYSASRDQAIPIPDDGKWLDPEAMEDARIWESSAAQVSIRHAEPDEKVLAEDLAGWLKKWELELGSNSAELVGLSGSAERVPETLYFSRNLIYTLILQRIHQTLGRNPEFPPVYPAAPFVALDGAPAPPGHPDWDDPAQYIRNRLAQLPVAYHPDHTAALDWIGRIAAGRDESLRAQLRRFLGELSLLSNAKLDAQVFTLALCSEDERRRSWQLSITHPIQISAALAAADCMAPQPVLFDPQHDSPGRLAGWLEALTLFWTNQIQKQLISARDRHSLSVQTDWFNPLPEQVTTRQLLTHFLRSGLATSFNVQARERGERYRLRVMLSALSLRLIRSNKSLRKLEDNFADFWLDDRDI